MLNKSCVHLNILEHVIKLLFKKPYKTPKLFNSLLYKTMKSITFSTLKTWNKDILRCLLRLQFLSIS